MIYLLFISIHSTAGSGGAIADANAEASICPKGWKLPTSGTQNNNANDSFYNLLKNYGLTSSVQGSSDGVNYNIATTPLYFVRSGYINTQMGRSRYAGIGGNYWSSVAASKLSSGTVTPSAYNLNFNATGVGPSNGPSYRWFGFPLRCLARRD